MATLAELVENLGGAVVELFAAPRGLEISLDRVVVYDSRERTEVGIGDVVLGVGLGAGRELNALLRVLGEAGAAALMVKGVTADEVMSEAQSAGIAVLAVPAGTPWAHVVTLVSSVLSADRFRGDGERLGDASAGDLFAVANSIADMVGAPITIEDPQSVVLAFSGRQDEADPARIATVLGRRVPELYRRMLNEQGIMRRLYSEPGVLHCPAMGPEGMPRVAIAVRAGDEVLGSIWAAVRSPLDPEREKALADAANFVALHLLRHQVAADAKRGLEADLIAAVLSGGSLAMEAARRLDMRGPQYRVLAVGIADVDREDREILLARCRNLLALQLSAVHRGAPTAHIGGVVYAVVPAQTQASQALAALRLPMDQYATRATALLKSRVLVGIGTQVGSVAEIPVSRGSADKVIRVLRAEGGRAVADIDEVRAHALLLDFAAAYGDDPAMSGGPLEALRVHDAAHHTSYTETLCAFLDGFGDIDNAARQLGVHSNTVRYRLRQLDKVVDLKLDDPSQRLALMLQLRIEKVVS
ncbi:MAG: helix-turn-helix domain-containing protein [Candidatus Dormibacteria bacterium]